MSSAVGDPYLDPASGMLRNLLGIKDAAELAQAEAALSASRLTGLELPRGTAPGALPLAPDIDGEHRRLGAALPRPAHQPGAGLGFHPHVVLGEIAARLLQASALAPESGMPCLMTA
ncbi:MAG: hypothetical protein ACRDPY_28980 [Streptosporangiaceae bacterium]